MENERLAITCYHVAGFHVISLSATLCCNFCNLNSLSHSYSEFSTAADETPTITIGVHLYR